MSLVALDGSPLIRVGVNIPIGAAYFALTSTLQDAANEACIMYGQIFTEDGGSHTIDTTGSSSLGWLTGAVTFANAGTTFKVGLATLDTATGPAARATNVANVITFSVSKSHTGGSGTVTASAWQTNVPDAGSLTIANGDFIAFCTQMTALGGVDAINTSTSTVRDAAARPGVTSFTGAAYSASSAAPNAVITFSDGTKGFFAGGLVASSVTTQTWNSASATKEYGNVLQFPFPAKVYGVYAYSLTLTGDCDFVLYSNPLGTPVAEKTVSVDANAVGSSAARPFDFIFSSPYSTTANQAVAVIAKPGATNVALNFKSLNASSDQKADHCGINGYAVNRAAGAFAAQNSSKDRFNIGLIVGAFDAGGSSGLSPAPIVIGRGTPY